MVATVSDFSDRGRFFGPTEEPTVTKAVTVATLFESAMDAHGQIRITKVLGQLARRPKLLPDFIHLARQSRIVLNKLADFLDPFVASFPPRPIGR